MVEFTVNDAVLRAARSLDATGLVANHRDNERPVEAKDMLVVLSTPRSGSNYFCDVIEKEGLCRLTEYFHPTIHMPILADRWGCVVDQNLNFIRYGQAFRNNVATESGWVGTKVLNDHLEFFVAAMPALKDLRTRWIHLIRRDHIAQAISLYVASQTGRWINNDPGSDGHVKYDYLKIKQRLNTISRGNDLIRAFITKLCIDPIIVYYEDVADDVENQIKRIPDFSTRPLSSIKSSFERQATGRNAEWAARFAEEFMAETFRNAAIARSMPTVNSVRRKIKSMIGV